MTVSILNLHEDPHKPYSTELSRLIASVAKAANNAPMLYVPVSGGSDSAFTYWLLNTACPSRVVGLYGQRQLLGSFRGLRNLEWFQKIGIVKSIRIKPWTEEARWAGFLSISLGRQGDKPGWLVGCRNRTEHWLGTYSLASRVATFLPIVGLSKSEVLEFSAQVGIPQNIIDSSRSADPDCGRPPEMAEIGVEYIDHWLMHPDTKHLSENRKEYLSKIRSANGFKLDLPTRINPDWRL